MRTKHSYKREIDNVKNFTRLFAPGLFSFMNFHFIGLTTSLGFKARYLIVSEIAVYPANRPNDNVVLRFAAMTCGIAPHRTGEASSTSTVPRIQCDLFSIDQCPRRPVSKRSADAASGFRLVIPNYPKS